MVKTRLIKPKRETLWTSLSLDVTVNHKGKVNIVTLSETGKKVSWNSVFFFFFLSELIQKGELSLGKGIVTRTGISFCMNQE